MNDDAFAPPAFKPDEALAGLKRGLRELGLTEREGRFELAARPVASLALEAGAITARMVKHPALSPQLIVSDYQLLSPKPLH